MSKRRTKGENSLYHEMRNGKKYWRAVVTVGIDKEGKPIRKTANGYDKSEVIAKMKDLESHNHGYINTDYRGTVEDLYRSWAFLIKKPHIHSLSFAKYEDSLRLRIQGTELGRTDIQKVTTLDIQKYFNDLSLDWSEATCKRTRMHLSSFFDYMVNEGVLVRNPCKNVKIKTQIKKPEEQKAYTRAEQEQIIQALDLEDPVEMMIYIAFASGLRLGELLALTWDDYKNGCLDVNKQYNRNAKIEIDGTVERTREIQALKTPSSYRQVPLPSAVQKKLNRYKIKILEFNMLHAEGYKKNNLIFPNEKGLHQNHNRPTRRLKKICSDIGVDYISFHATRHSYITRLFEQGVHFKKIQSLAGHSTAKTTLEIYTHTNQQMLIDAVDELSNIF